MPSQADETPSPFTAPERDLIRREMGMRFGQLPSLADGLSLRTWRGGEHKGEPKIPPACLRPTRHSQRDQERDGTAARVSGRSTQEPAGVAVRCRGERTPKARRPRRRPAMPTRFFLTTCAAAALTSAALAQTTQPTAPAPTQTLPGWGGTPAPQAGQAAAPPGGLVTVTPEAVVTFYAAQPVDMTASNLMGTEVRNLQDERLGEIEDLVIGGGREIAAVVVGVGGFLGLGERYAALPPSAVVLARQPDGSLRAVVNATREALRNSPEFKFEGNVRR